MNKVKVTPVSFLCHPVETAVGQEVAAKIPTPLVWFGILVLHLVPPAETITPVKFWQEGRETYAPYKFAHILLNKWMVMIRTFHIFISIQTKNY